MKFVVLFLAVAICTTKASEGPNRNVTIAVVEYYPTVTSPDQIVLNNTEEYVKLIESVNDPTLDMIIFPEATLRNNPQTAVEIKINNNPCDSSDVQFLQKLSCAARNFTTYLVVNLVEKEKCNETSSSKNCKKTGFFFYNTDVVFDRQGTIVNKYRKYNLFGENELDRPSIAEEVIITTDFGVKYGIFTCFDILFKNPAQDLLTQNIDGVIFPTMWFSELPFLTALQTQQMWAHTHNVKLFAAGANDPLSGSGGSGFYSGDQGMILNGINRPAGSRVFIYKYVTGASPVDYNPQEPAPYEDIDILSKYMDGFYLKRDSSIDEYNSTVLDLTKTNLTENLCYENRLCCEFNVEINVDAAATEKNTYVYHLVAFSGVRSFSGTYNGGMEICGIIACLNSSLSSCGRRFLSYNEIDWPITFEKINIKANFEKSDNRTQYPNSLLSSIRPINASQTEWKEKKVTIEGKTMIERSFSLKEAQNRILTFAIYGRKFDEDYPPNDDSSATLTTVNLFMAVFVVILTIVP